MFPGHVARADSARTTCLLPRALSAAASSSVPIDDDVAGRWGSDDTIAVSSSVPMVDGPVGSLRGAVCSAIRVAADDFEQQKSLATTRSGGLRQSTAPTAPRQRE
jgi:hypothetical protein